MKRRVAIMLSIFSFAIAVTFVDAFVHPNYFVKILIKILFFLALPMLFFVKNKTDFQDFKKLFVFKKKGILQSFLLGIGVFASGYAFSLDILFKAGALVSGLGALMVILMKGRETKNPVARIFNGILGLYDITSYVSDALSYSRLMALGLATGVIAQVVNIMGSLVGNGILGMIVFVIVFIAGHALNFAINALGAYVHTNRLQCVEFYSKFYEGGGREFSPLSVNTKYFKFMEDE